VIYTSGSTGRPKAVVVTYDSVASLLRCHRRDLYQPAVRAAGRTLRAALAASCSFDTFWEPVLFMLDGHGLHLIGEQERRDPEAITSSLFAELRAAWPPG
jgi:non-ribosomal peptide synthetase component F